LNDAIEDETVVDEGTEKLLSNDHPTDYDSSLLPDEGQIDEECCSSQGNNTPNWEEWKRILENASVSSLSAFS
jgi:hypothetical protein